MAVPVVVEKSTASAPAGWSLLPKPGFPGHVGECSISVVAIEPVLSEVGAEDVVKAVVVIVGDADSVCPACCFQAGLLGYIREGAIAVVLIEPIGRFGRVTLQARPREQENVHPAVIVVINEGAPATVCLQDVFLVFNPAIDDLRVQASRFRDIRQARWKRTLRGHRNRLRLHIPCRHTLLGTRGLSSGTKREQDKRATSDRHQEGSLLTLDCPDAGRNSVVKPEGTSAA